MVHTELQRSGSASRAGLATESSISVMDILHVLKNWHN